MKTSDIMNTNAAIDPDAMNLMDDELEAVNGGFDLAEYLRNALKFKMKIFSI